MPASGLASQSFGESAGERRRSALLFHDTFLLGLDLSLT